MFKKTTKGSAQIPEAAIGDFQVKNSKTGNLLAKIFCVIAAVVIWFYAVDSDSPTYEKSFNEISIEIKEPNNNLSVISGFGIVADVTAKGRQSEINKLNSRDITTYVDVTGVETAGKYDLPVVAELPNGMTLVDVYPEKITVYVDETDQMQVPVNVVLTNYTIPNDYILDSYEPSVASVSVKGPKEELAKIKEARITLDFELAALTGSVTTSSVPALYDENDEIISNPYVKMQTASIDVDIEICVKKDISLVLNYKNGFYNSENSEITISPQKITVKGSVEAMEDFDSIVLATIDETAIDNNTDMSCVITLPLGIENVDDIKNATVSIKHKNTSVKTIVANNIIIKNAPSDKNVNIITKALNVRVRGAGAAFDAISSLSVSVVVDLKNVSTSTGTQTVYAEVALTGGNRAEMYILGSYNVTVEITEKQV